jgi:hypothetical protein
MPRNQKLTRVIAGRTVKAATVEPGAVLVLFDDQSNMKIETAGPARISPGGKAKSVHEAKAEFKIDFEDGPSATLCLADPDSSVAVRDKNHAVDPAKVFCSARMPVKIALNCASIPWAALLSNCFEIRITATEIKMIRRKQPKI